eukprot:TRINITY_DN28537_c0_g1_i1.p1 TRINITY_DN28537_c0_g1~~TRINITY_DN28537_c0_g1_i1.p1  ORF type:complete len:360 (-),score=81.40 TRINITY_DN28537_c0_g1_i1:70-1149(-)
MCIRDRSTGNAHEPVHVVRDRSAMSERDPYEVLGVPRSASFREVRSAYKTLALQKHPDRADPDERESTVQEFQEISVAYESIAKHPAVQMEELFSEPQGSQWAEWCKQPTKDKILMADTFIRSGEDFSRNQHWELAIDEFQCTLRLFEKELHTRDSNSLTKSVWTEVSAVAIRCQTKTAGCLLEAVKKAILLREQRRGACAQQPGSLHQDQSYKDQCTVIEHNLKMLTVCFKSCLAMDPYPNPELLLYVAEGYALQGESQSAGALIPAAEAALQRYVEPDGTSIVPSELLLRLERVKNKVAAAASESPDGAPKKRSTHNCSECGAVSYTHLTLPTKRIVEISEGAGSLKKKRKRRRVES